MNDEFEPDLIFVYCSKCDEDYEVPEDVAGQYYCPVCCSKIYTVKSMVYGGSSGTRTLNMRIKSLLPL